MNTAVQYILETAIQEVRKEGFKENREVIQKLEEALKINEGKGEAFVFHQVKNPVPQRNSLVPALCELLPIDEDTERELYAEGFSQDEVIEAVLDL